MNRPITGHWFITPNFFNFVDETKFRSLDKQAIHRAFHLAGNYISMQNVIQNEDEEYRHFLEYYRIFSSELPKLELTESQLNSITYDLVYNYKKYEFYKDVFELIPELSKTYKLAVVSNAWPSLDNVFRQADLRKYFSSFVISSQIGVIKPHELMYKIALEELNMSPSEVLFVDDNVGNCVGAEKIGIRSLVLSRDWKLYMYYKFMRTNHSVVYNLKGAIKHLKEME